MELPSDKTRLQLEITNWPKDSQKSLIITILIALLGYGFTWYVDRHEHLQQVHDEQIRFERQQLRASIEQKMEAYEKVEKAIGNIRRIWYIARAKCAFDKTYTTDPRKIEAVNLERWNARIDLMEVNYAVGLAYGNRKIEESVYAFNQWERSIKNVCAKNSPSGEDYRERQTIISDALVKELSADRLKLKTQLKADSVNF